jgi:hypothetical protein
MSRDSSPIRNTNYKISYKGKPIRQTDVTAIFAEPPIFHSKFISVDNQDGYFVFKVEDTKFFGRTYPIAHDSEAEYLCRMNFMLKEEPRDKKLIGLPTIFEPTIANGQMFGIYAYVGPNDPEKPPRSPNVDKMLTTLGFVPPKGNGVVILTRYRKTLTTHDVLTIKNIIRATIEKVDCCELDGRPYNE